MNTANELIKSLRDVTPVIWEAAIRQKTFEGIAYLIGCIVFIVIALVALALHQRDKGSCLDDGKWIVLCGFSILIGIVSGIGGIMVLLNPEYWAIMALKP